MGIDGRSTMTWKMFRAAMDARFLRRLYPAPHQVCDARRIGAEAASADNRVFRFDVEIGDWSEYPADARGSCLDGGDASSFGDRFASQGSQSSG